jgi:hypothetical protein
MVIESLYSLTNCMGGLLPCCELPSGVVHMARNGGVCLIAHEELRFAKSHVSDFLILC